jgi:hypothetical protein
MSVNVITSARNHQAKTSLKLINSNKKHFNRSLSCPTDRSRAIHVFGENGIWRIFRSDKKHSNLYTKKRQAAAVIWNITVNDFFAWRKWKHSTSERVRTRSRAHFTVREKLLNLANWYGILFAQTKKPARAIYRRFAICFVECGTKHRWKIVELWENDLFSCQTFNLQLLTATAGVSRWN